MNVDLVHILLVCCFMGIWLSVPFLLRQSFTNDLPSSAQDVD